MGYCYDLHGRLACDACGSTGTTRKRTCPHRVTYADGSTLPYCKPAALCRDCYPTRKTTLHQGCSEGAEKANERERVLKTRLDKTVPAGYDAVGARFVARHVYRYSKVAELLPSVWPTEDEAMEYLVENYDDGEE